LAGGSYTDIQIITGISVASFYRIVWKTINAINKSASSLLSIKFPSTTMEADISALGFQSISQQGCIWNCVGVVDGYHLQIDTPSKAEAKNVKSFFSGHYQTYGVNIQATCDHHCRFTFIGVAGPGVMGDREAIGQISLGKLIEALPGLYCVIGDCAYTPTEHLVPIFRGDQALLPRNDNFNFFASQLRIRIEMAFGIMVKKWSILSRPLTVKLKNIKKIIVTIAKLHNYCINERLGNVSDEVYTPRNVAFTQHQIMLREQSAYEEFEELQHEYENAWSNNRDRMVKEIEALKLTRPGKKNMN
jgi:DDE superfamily endonuclease